MSDQVGLSVEEQAAELTSCIEAFDRLIADIDRIIEIYRRERTAFIEKRAEFDAIKSLLTAPAAPSVETVSKSFNPVLAGIEAGAVAVGAGILSGHPIAATIIAGEAAINHALDEALKDADEQNARIEQTLQQQRDWFRDHQGREGG